MGELLAVSIPLAVGAALSPMMLATTTGLLAGRDRPRRRALAFLLGAALPVAALVVITFTAVGPAITSAVRGADTVLADIDLALGCVLVLLAGRFTLWPPRRRTRAPRSTPRPVWWNTLLGVLLEGRDLHSMVLTFGALQHAAVAHVRDSAKAAVAGAVVAIVLLPVWLPIVAHVTLPPGLRQRMERSRAWVTAHEQPVLVGVCLVLGAYLLVRGATGH